jgi:hypothetical protein
VRRPLEMLVFLAAFGLLVGLPPARAQSPQTGSVVFEARVTPTDGRPESVRQITFYLLRKSYAEIQKEAEATETELDLDHFIDGLEVSKELKTWMKRQHSIVLSGSDFLHRLKTDDIFEVPEFYNAYLKFNSGGASVDFPTPKYRDADKEKNPAKYAKQKEDYQAAVRKYLAANPSSIEGIETFLDQVNPSERWTKMQIEVRQRVRRRTSDLVQLRYLAAKTDSDLEGRGIFTGIAPGDYWISTLETQAVAGDVRLRWDAPVSVRAGETSRVELSNLNASEHRPPAK